ncbi:MAG: hypothetical protein ACLGHP_02650 [Vicinamibacteria bacterium]
MRARLAALTPGERFVLVAGALLIVDLLVLPWHDVPFNDAERRAAVLLGFDPTPTGVQAPDSGYGIAAVAFTALLAAHVALTRLLGVRVPQPGVPWAMIHQLAGVFVLVVLVFKLLRETAYLGVGAYLGLLAAMFVAYGGVVSRGDEPAP